jgi:hypothetical protein
MNLIDVVAWAIFVGLGPVLWVSGVRLFVRSSLSRRWKTVWVLFLVFVGIGIGYALPLPGIRNRFLALLVALPLLAIIDSRLAKSNRRLSFWFRACSFEICTVFGIAAVARLTIDRVGGSP